MAKAVQAVSADLTSRFANESRYLVRNSSEFEEVTKIYERSMLEISGHEFCYAALKGDNKFVSYVNFLVLRTTITPEFRIMGLWFAVHGNKVEVVKEMMEDLNRPSHFQFDIDTLLKAYSISIKGSVISNLLLSELQKKGVTPEVANKFRDKHVEKDLLEVILPKFSTMTSDQKSKLLEEYFKINHSFMVDLLIEKGVEIPASMFRYALEKNDKVLLDRLQNGRSSFSLVSKKHYTDKELLGFVYPEFSAMSEDAKSKLFIRFYEAGNNLMYNLILNNFQVIPKRVLKYLQRACKESDFKKLMLGQSAYVLDKDGKVVTRDSYSICAKSDKDTHQYAIFRINGENIASGNKVFIEGPCLSNKFLRIFAYLGAIFSPYKVAAFTFNEDVKDQAYVKDQVRDSKRKTYYCWMHTEDIESYTRSLKNVPKNSIFKIVSSWVRFKVVLRERVA